MDYDVWACIDGGNPIRITVASDLDGKYGVEECLDMAAVVWESLALRGAVMRNSHPRTGQYANDWLTQRRYAQALTIAAKIS